MDAFISWTGKDRDVKNVLVEKLQAAGISCWDSDEYCTSDYSQECIAAIKRCGVFIVIVSDASMRTGYVKNEIIAARKQEEAGLLNMLVYKITDAPLTDDFEFQLNHISIVSGNLVQRQEHAIDAIVTRAQRLLQLRQDGEPEKPFRVAVPQVEGWKIAGSTGYFVENSRDDILQAIEDGFSRDNVIVLTEFIGFGKRTVIRKYLSHHPLVKAVMVNNQYGSLRDFLLLGLSFANLNPALFEGLEGDVLIDAKLRQLEKLDELTLLVIPDLVLAPDPELYRKLLTLRCRIILLTQGSADHCCDLMPVIRVGKMEDPYLTELFFHHYTRAFEEEKEQLQAPLEDFFDQIGGHTRTVELTASVLNRDLGIMPADVPDYLSLQGTEGMALKDRILSQISHLFVLEQLTPGQIKALLFASCLAVPYLSEQHFRQLLRSHGIDNWQEIMDLDDRRWLDLDPQNRTVTIEPLVAQIVLQRFPGEYGVLVSCCRYLEDAFTQQLNASDSPSFLAANFARMEHFFRITGLEAMAELSEAMKHSLSQKDTAVDELKAAIAMFQRDYPAEDFSERPEQIPEPPDRSYYTHIAQEFVRTVLLPMAKLHSSEVASIFNDYSAGSARILTYYSDQLQDITLDLEQMLGMSREEFTQWLDWMRQSVIQDKDDMQTLVLTETIAMTDALYRRDHRSMLLSMQNLLEQLEQQPQLLADPELADSFSMTTAIMASTYLRSGAYTAAARLCEQVLQYSCRSSYQVMLRKVYVISLYNLDQYTDTLCDACAALLESMDIYSAQIFENRQEQQKEKQHWLLLYAEILARAERGEEAAEQFAKARKLGMFQPNDLVRSAKSISDSLVRGGAFDEAMAFLKQHFSLVQQQALMLICDEQNQKILEEFADLQALELSTKNDFEANTDPEQHLSYYHEYSRKNNSLLDRKYCTVADQAMDFDFSDLSEEEIAAHALKLRSRATREPLLRLAPEAFALASEAGFRVLGYRHHYVQYMGAAAMADGKIAEILNGEGKTYTIVLTAFLQWLYRKKVYVVDESEYLTQRNHNWMQGVYQLLGMKTAHILMDRELPNSKADVLYISLRRMMFGYLSHELSIDSVRGDLKLDVAIVDEIDTVLVDAAKERYSITEQKKDPNSLRQHDQAWQLVEKLGLDPEYFTVSGYAVTLQPAIYPLMERAFRVSWEDMERLPLLNKLERLVKCAIICRYCYQENKDYFIHKGLPVLEDKTRGVFSVFNETYEYFLCLHCGLDATHSRERLRYQIKNRNIICVKELFRKFRTVCGTTATAVSFQKEFKDIYDLEYVAVPPHKPCIRQDTQSPLYLKARYKDRAILDMVAQKHELGQPILLITQSTEESEKYHRLLKRAGIPHRLLNARNAEEAAGILSTAGMPGSVLVANALVSRGADIRLGGNPERETLRTLVEMGVDTTGLEDFLYRLPTPEQKESELYKKYYSILAQNKLLMARQRQEVVAAGGLCVIGTSFFAEARNEQQTRGRSGRQGEVGESRVFRSMEDPALKQMFSASYLEMLENSIDGVEEMDFAVLRSALLSAQKRLHNASFAQIRKVNSTSLSIEQYRKDFIGLRMELAEGLVTTDALLESWARDKVIHRQLQVLQQGGSCESIALKELWACDERLKTAKGMGVYRILLDAFQKKLESALASLDPEAQENGRAYCMRKHLLDAWQSYIEIALDTVGQVNIKEQALNKFLEQEKDRLLRQSIERLIYIHLRENT